MNFNSPYILALGVFCFACSVFTSTKEKEGDVILDTSTPIDSLARITFTNKSAQFLPLNDLSSNTMDMEAADINKDGFIDLILAMEYQKNIILISNQGKNFKNMSSDLFEPWPLHDSEDIAIADFNMDGRVDFYVATEDDVTDEYYLQNERGKFILSNSLVPNMSKSNAVLSIDVNNDNAPDLILGNEGQNYVFINDGNGGFIDETQERLPSSGFTTQDIEAGDINGDGYLDLVFGNEQNNEVLVNDTFGKFNDATDKFITFPSNPEETREVDLSDIDNDGDLDMFFANVTFNVGQFPKNRILLNEGNKYFSDQTQTLLDINPEYISVDVDFADIDGDGDMDIFLANSFGAPQQVYANINGTFYDASSVWLPKELGIFNAIDVEVLDINHDGKLDIYYTIFQGSDILLVQD